MGITLVAGFAFGGVRVAFKRLLPERSEAEGQEFISLNIDESVRELDAARLEFRRVPADVLRRVDRTVSTSIRSALAAPSYWQVSK